MTLANTGLASISISDISIAGAFTTAAGGTCSTLPITLAPNAACTEYLAFLPTTVGALSGSVVFGGAGVVPQSILLVGSGTQTLQSATTVSLTSSNTAPFAGQPITFTVTVKPAVTGTGTPAGTVSLYDGTILIGTGQPLVGGSASVSTATLVAGAHNITAVYSGDANFLSSSSIVLVQNVLGFSLASSPGNPNNIGQTVEPGQTATFTFNLQAISAAASFPVSLSATGLPPGATATFTPNPVTISASPTSFTMSIPVPPTTSSLRGTSLFGSMIAIGLLLPWSRRFRRLRLPPLCVALLLGIAAVGGVAGCGSASGYSGQSPQIYTIQVIATATGTNGATLQEFISVKLTVQ